MSKSKIIILLFLLSHAYYLAAQSQESGYTREYNGKEEKTALSGVELSISGSSSTISDENGYFELHFPILKPGQNVVCNEIYKEGYIIFNKDAINAWRISNNQQPFIILLCKEKNFRELKKKYYNIFEKSYKKEYELQKEKAIQEAVTRELLQTQLEKIEREYAEKIQNINTYIEIFSRIDLNSMNEIEAEALRLLEAEDIDAAIRKYEELSISQKSEEQILKLSSGVMVKKAGEEIINTAHNDLIVLAEKLKTQLGLYEAGGSAYDAKKKETIKQLVNLYRSLNEAFDSAYNEELGTWLIQLSSMEYRKASYLQLVNEAASLPSSDGLCELGRVYEILSYNNDSLLSKAYACYKMSDSLYREKEDATTLSVAALQLQRWPVTSFVSDSMELFFRILDEKEHLVSICPKSMMASCNASGNIILPSKVTYHGVTYQIAQIDKDAFAFNDRPFQVTIPASIKTVEIDAFRAAKLEEITFLGKNTIACFSENNYAFPTKAIIHAPQNAPQMYKWMKDMYLNMGEINIPNLFPSATAIIEYLATESANQDDKIAYYYQLVDMYSDTISPLFNIEKSKAALKQIERIVSTQSKETKANGYIDLIEDYYGQIESLFYDSIRAYSLANAIIKCGKKYQGKGYLLLGELYYQDKQYEKAFLYFKKAFADGEIDGAKKIAIMYAVINKDIARAQELTSSLIEKHPDRADLYSLQGDFFLLQGDTAMAKQCCDSVLLLSLNTSKFKDIATSNLYKACYPKDSSEVISKENKFKRRQFYQRVVDLAKIVSSYEYEKIHETPIKLEYEELLSISIIAAQALIKNKTEQQLRKYNDIYFVSAMAWAIHNELKYRYGRLYKLFIEDYADLTDDFYQLGYEDSFILRLIIFQNIIGIYNYYIKHPEQNRSEEIFSKGEAILQCVKELPNKDSYVIRQVLLNKQSPENIATERNLDIDSVLLDIAQKMQIITEKVNLYRFSTRTERVSVTNETFKNTEKFQKIASAVAAIEYKYYSLDGTIGEDYEDFLQIANIVLKVFFQDKTEEQIAQYKASYIATILRFGIENEILNRYQLPTQKGLGYFMDTSIESEQILVARVAIYRTIGLFYNNQSFLQSYVLEKDIHSIVKQGSYIADIINHMGDITDQQLSADIVFGLDDATTLLNKYNVTMEYISNLINLIVELLNNRNATDVQ